MSRPRRQSVSLCMIVRNEGHQLVDCLSPVAELFDEIVVVDTGSRDDTRAVARRFTTKLFDFPWCDDFSAARNESLRHAQGNWIFWLDADDRILPENIARLRELMSGLDRGPDAYMMETAVRMDRDSRDSERLVSHLRLFRRHPALSWSGRVHEQIRPWPTAVGLEVGCSPVRIEHVGYAYADGVKLHCRSTTANNWSGGVVDKAGQQHGIRFEGADGWIFVSRGRIEASNPDLLTTPLPASATRLYVSENHMRNFFDCVRSREQPICDAEIGHRSVSVCHLGVIALRLGRKLQWNPATEHFMGDSDANTWLAREMRKPWSYESV